VNPPRPGAARDPAEPRDVIAAMADPTRRQLLALLADSGPATATELAGCLPVTRQAVAKHLSLLSRAGLVSGERQGRDVRFAVVTGGLTSTASWLVGLAAEWDTRLAEIKQIAEVAPE
jgi:DNA-binding transcriptional ArsR family regulator